MEKNQTTLEKMHLAEGIQKLNALKQRINTTKYNIEVSNEIIHETPSDKVRNKLIEKNIQREHAVGSLKKEIRDIEQTIEERSHEV